MKPVNKGQVVSEDNFSNSLGERSSSSNSSSRRTAPATWQGRSPSSSPIQTTRFAQVLGGGPGTPAIPQFASSNVGSRPLAASHRIISRTTAKLDDDLKDISKGFPLHLAAESGDVITILFLIQQRTEINSQDLFQRTPLYVATLQNHLDAVKCLLDNGANPGIFGIEGDNILHVAALYGYLSLLEYLLTRQQVKNLLHNQDNDGTLPIHKSVWLDSKPEIVALLLKQGANPNAIDKFGNTPLHWVAKNGHLESARLLIRQGALTTIVNVNGDTPLSLALKWGQNDIVCLLKEAPSATGDDTALPMDLPDLEGIYYGRFEQAYEEGRLYEQVHYLEKLGDLYISKKKYLEAACLLNSGHAAAVLYALDASSQQAFLRKLEKIEGLFLEHLGKKIPADYESPLQEHRLNLKSIRAQAKLKLEKGNPIESIQAEMTADFQSLLDRLIQNCMDLLGPAPVSYAIMGLGSMSRQEMCPYSDAEFAILIENDSDEAMTYFRALSRLLELKVLNLGETHYSVIRPKRIEGKMTDAKSFTPHGFSMDIGGLSPLGKTGVYELIGTPKQLAMFQEPHWLELNESEVILANAMTNGSFVIGNRDLLACYVKSMQEILGTKQKFKEKTIHKERALNLLKGHLEEFSPLLDENRIKLKGFDVKKDLYRPLQMVVGALTLYYGLESISTLSQIETLHQQGVFSRDGASRLQNALRRVLSWRLETHLYYQTETEIMYHAQGPEDPKAKGLLSFDTQRSQELIEIYRVLVPFNRTARDFLRGDERSFSRSTFYDETVGTSTRAEENELDYHAALITYTQSVALQPENPEALDDLQRINIQLGESKKALSYNLDLYRIMKAKYGDTAHPHLANVLNNLGTTYNNLHEPEKAVNFHEQALTMYTKYYEDRPHPNVVIVLANLGKIYSGLGEIRKGIMYLEKAFQMSTTYHGDWVSEEDLGILAMLGKSYFKIKETKKAIGLYETVVVFGKRIFGDKPHPYLIAALSTLGTIYEIEKKNQKAIAFFEQTLVLQKRLHGNRPHQEIAATFDSLGDCYNKSEDVKKAISYHEQSLALYQSLPENPPQLIRTLNCLAVDYQSLGDSRKAIAYLEQALALQKQIPENKVDLNVAATFHHLFDIYSNIGEIKKAISYLEQALVICKKLANDTPDAAVVGTLVNMGNAHKAINEPQEAINFFMQALAMQKQLHGDKPHSDVAETMVSLGKLFHNLNHPSGALTFLGQALAINRELHGDKPEAHISDIFNTTGAVYKALGKNREAIECYKQSLAINNQLYGKSARKETAILFSNLGVAYKALGEIEEALSFYMEAFTMQEQLNGNQPSLELATLLNNIGTAYRNLEKTEEACAYLKQALVMKQELYGKQPHPDVAGTLINIGNVYASIEDTEQAIIYFERALEMLMNTVGENHPHTKIVQNNLAQLRK